MVGGDDGGGGGGDDHHRRHGSTNDGNYVGRRRFGNIARAPPLKGLAEKAELA